MRSRFTKPAERMTPQQSQIVSLALGRIFRMGARATQPGDVQEYERCRRIIMDIVEEVSPEIIASAEERWQ